MLTSVFGLLFFGIPIGGLVIQDLFIDLFALCYYIIHAGSLTKYTDSLTYQGSVFGNEIGQVGIL